ncbi:hypothetical protein Dcar01_01855 [Deinococcus carri]|uniref:SMODS-associated and fused to various effectors domain-containing protein n=1 Tax=Deinococcus carri TaxID=1211323 RepID=A0ABP9W6Z4_9DEIO
MTKRSKKPTTKKLAQSAGAPKAESAATEKRRSETHKNLGTWDTIRLWVAAGGRCQRCNELLTESPTSWDPLNLAERAHIVAQTEGGPRGQEGLSNELATSLENVMLLCLKCHKEIDDAKLLPKFSVDRLRKMKAQHEERVRYLTDLRPKRTRILLLTTPIRQPADAGNEAKDREVVLREVDAREAILPDYFADSPHATAIRVEIEGEEDAVAWQSTFRRIKQRFDAKVQGEQLDHLSVFGLGKIPALAYLGHLIGDTRPVTVFNVSNGVPQKWQEAGPANFEYQVNRPPRAERPSRDVLLLLSLSGPVVARQYAGRVPEGSDVYEIANEEKYQQLNWLVAEKQLQQFGTVYQDLLSEIQRTHGQDAVIHVLAAAPAAVAIEVGRLHRSNSHPRLEVYNCVGGFFSPALTLRRGE